MFPLHRTADFGVSFQRRKPPVSFAAEKTG